MENTPLVSFVIPACNVPSDMLRECIDSILALSLREHEREIIIVDDGSLTPALGQIGDLADSVVYIRQRNGGLSSARNRGLQNATGQYVQFVDGDDAIVSALYEHCLDIARFQKPDMVTFDFCRKPTQQKTYTDQPALSGQELMRRQNIRSSACSYLFRTAILGNLRFTHGTYHEDEEFTPLLMLRAETIVQTDAPAYFYRQRDNSIMTSRDTRNTLKRLNDLKTIIYRLHRRADTVPRSERMALLRRIHQLTMDYIYKVIIETRNKHYLNRQLDELRTRGLFPLPDRNYTRKYTWFRRMTNSAIGLNVLMRILPLMKRER